jgi:hypothetical protein
MAAMTVEQLYERQVKRLPAAERLRLATLILNNIPLQTVMDMAYDWEEEDEETERAAWHALSLQALSKASDNRIDRETWDNWQPPKTKKNRARRKEKR